MTPEQMRRIADIVERPDECGESEAEIRALARLLREQADADELRQQYAAHGVPTPGECAALQADAMGWRPIATAPRDGTQIVLGRTDWLSMPVAKWGTVDTDDGAFGAWLIDDPNFCAGVEDGVLGWNEDIEEGSMPTHWMPLLPPQDGGR